MIYSRNHNNYFYTNKQLPHTKLFLIQIIILVRDLSTGLIRHKSNTGQTEIRIKFS